MAVFKPIEIGLVGGTRIRIERDQVILSWPRFKLAPLGKRRSDLLQDVHDQVVGDPKGASLIVNPRSD
jgi:hypothetical protein